jgi:hypothetical protein
MALTTFGIVFLIGATLSVRFPGIAYWRASSLGADASRLLPFYVAPPGRALVRGIAVLVSNETTRASTLQRRTLPPRRRPTTLVHPFFLFAVLRQSINSPSNFRDLPNFQNP